MNFRKRMSKGLNGKSMIWVGVAAAFAAGVAGRELFRGARTGVGAVRNRLRRGHNNAHLGASPSRSHVMMSSHPEAGQYRH